MSDEMIRLDLRERAVFAERSAGQPVSLATLWRQLTSGQIRIVESFVLDRCYVVVREHESENSAAPLSRRQLRILEALLGGCDNKTVAYDFEIKPSTVSQAARQALLQLGVDCAPGRVCPLLAVAARASCHGCDQAGLSAKFTCEGRSYRVFGAARPDDLLAPVLPPAQYAVVRGLLEGQPYIEIARRRGTSTRTVANQLAAVFRRMGVSGRGSLLHHLISSSGAQLRSA